MYKTHVNQWSVCLIASQSWDFNTMRRSFVSAAFGWSVSLLILSCVAVRCDMVTNADSDPQSLADVVANALNADRATTSNRDVILKVWTAIAQANEEWVRSLNYVQIKSLKLTIFSITSARLDSGTIEKILALDADVDESSLVIIASVDDKKMTQFLEPLMNDQHRDFN